ncbi:MAG TPA: hypothetical protein DHV62_06510 [Elusimicrobia bacterium]|jgi:TolA-binding protein|nr:hypothetical protein [Elusimicrobiota bacterium]
MPKAWVRKELKKEPLSNFVTKIIPWILAHRETALSIIATLVIVVGLGVYFFYHLKKIDTRAWERLSFAQAHQQRNLSDQAINLYNEIIQRYPRAKATSYALFYKAETLYQQKKYTEASQTYQNFLQKYRKKRLLLPLAYLGLGTSLESENKYLEAINIYQEFVNKFPEHFLTPEVYLSLGRCYQISGQKNEAINTYNKVVTSYPGSNWQKIAEIHLKMLQ